MSSDQRDAVRREQRVDLLCGVIAGRAAQRQAQEVLHQPRPRRTVRAAKRHLAQRLIFHRADFLLGRQQRHQRGSAKTLQQRHVEPVGLVVELDRRVEPETPAAEIHGAGQHHDLAGCIEPELVAVVRRRGWADQVDRFQAQRFGRDPACLVAVGFERYAPLLQHDRTILPRRIESHPGDVASHGTSLRLLA